MNTRKEDAVAASAEKTLTDRRYDRLRTPRARMGIAITALVVIALVPPAYALNSSLGVLLVGATFLMWVLLRLAVRTIADLPDTFLDERQRAVRDAAFREAFLWFAGLAVVLANAMLVLFLIRSTDGVLDVSLTWEVLFPWAWVVMAAAMCLPSIVLAIRDRELPE